MEDQKWVLLIFLFDFNAKSGSQLNNVSHRTALKAVKELNGTFMCGGTVTVRNLMLQISKILMPFQVEMAKRDDQKRRERELDLNMRWGESKDGKNRDRVRDRGRSRSRSGERTPGLYVPLLRDTYFFLSEDEMVFWVSSNVKCTTKERVHCTRCRVCICMSCKYKGRGECKSHLNCTKHSGFFTGTPPKRKYRKVIYAWLRVSRTIDVNVNSSNQVFSTLFS